MSKLMLRLVAVGCFFAFSVTTTLAQSLPDKIVLQAQISPAQSTHPLKPATTSCDDANVLHYFKEAARECLQQGANNYFHDFSDAGGNGVFVLDTKTLTMEFEIEYNNLSGPTLMAHFHTAPPGKPGPIVQTLCGPPPALPGHSSAAAIGHSGPQVAGQECPTGRSGILKGTYKIEGNNCGNGKNKMSCTVYTAQEELTNLLCGNIYVNLHTFLNQAGEVRGQIFPLTYPDSLLATCNKLPPKK